MNKIVLDLAQTMSMLYRDATPSQIGESIRIAYDQGYLDGSLSVITRMETLEAGLQADAVIRKATAE